jgi:hypoxanthine-DNA glycosylase
MKKSGFPPIINQNTEILILGSLPSDKSIQANEYYANPQNQFWKIIFAIFNNNVPLVKYNEKTDLLLKNKIGLWDVMTEADRNGSLDSNIRNEKINDFNELFEQHPKIKKLAFNGDKAFKTFMRIKVEPTTKELITLTSSSSANTSKTVQQKLREWEIALK